MKQIAELKQGDKLYSISFIGIVTYKYLCVHPTGQGKYHILIDQFQNPIRMHEKVLQNILDKNLKNWTAASIALVYSLEEEVNRLRLEIKETNNLMTGDQIEFVSGNYIGLTGVVIETDYDSKDKRAMYGYLHTVKLSNGKIGYVEKSEHWRFLQGN